MDEWTKRKQLGAVLLAGVVSYVVGWFWIVFLGNAAGNVDGSYGGHFVLITVLGAITIVIAVIGLYLAAMAIGFLLAAVGWTVTSPYRLFKYLQLVGVRVLGGWFVNLVAVVLGMGVLYVLGRWTADRMEADATTGDAIALWAVAIVGGGLFMWLGLIFIGFVVMVPIFLVQMAVGKLPKRRPVAGERDGTSWLKVPIITVGAVAGFWYAAQDSWQLTLLAASVGGIWSVFVVIAVYQGLIYGLYRLSQWIRVAARLVPQIGGQLPRPKEEFWSPAPVLAWRSWRVTDHGLVGAWQALWSDDHMVATCDRLPHHAPDWDCRCGIYGLKEMPVSVEPGVTGIVELSGQVIEHEDGYRAEKARIKQLWLTGRKTTKDQLQMLRSKFPDVVIEDANPRHSDLTKWGS